MASSTAVGKFLPYVCEAVESLVLVARLDGDNLGILQTVEVAQHRPAFLQRILVGEYEDMVTLTLGE